MYAIEFEADVHNHAIQIPEKYKELEGKQIKVLVIDVETKQTTLPDGQQFPLMPETHVNNGFQN